MLLLFQKDLCRNSPVPGHLAEVTVSQAGERDGRSFGRKDWKKLQKGNEQMEAKERKECRGGEINGSSGGWKVSAPTQSLSPSLSPTFFFCHSDVSVRLCFINESNYGMYCQGNYMAHQKDSQTLQFLYCPLARLKG